MLLKADMMAFTWHCWKKVFNRQSDNEKNLSVLSNGKVFLMDSIYSPISLALDILLLIALNMYHI